MVLDTTGPRSGLGSLRLDADAAPASAVSDPFVPPGGPELLVRTWLRSSRPDSRVRVWIEGKSGDQDVSRMAALEGIPSDWAERKVRVADLPAGGLQWARLRFELMAPGRLWIDDLAVSSTTGQQLSELDRRALEALCAAQIAYRENRLADFARWTNSRWVRPEVPVLAAHPGLDAVRSR